MAYLPDLNTFTVYYAEKLGSEMIDLTNLKLVYSQVHIRSLTTTKEAFMEFEQTFTGFSWNTRSGTGVRVISLS